MTGCATGDVNYNLCVVLTERLAEQQDRLDLVWFGAWALVGLALLAAVAFAVRAVFT